MLRPRAHAAGLVITGQRPGTATGVDPRGRDRPAQRHRLEQPLRAERRIVLGARLMGVTGEVQREGEIVHLIAHKLEDRTALLGGLRTVSRDFC